MSRILPALGLMLGLGIAFLTPSFATMILTSGKVVEDNEQNGYYLTRNVTKQITVQSNCYNASANANIFLPTKTPDEWSRFQQWAPGNNVSLDPCATCNNNRDCEATENYASCPSDCPPCNYNGTCDPGETMALCSNDCTCGDHYCNPLTENADNCPDDCVICGDGVCNGTENLANCPLDCFRCGDGICTRPWENVWTCAQDCPTRCGDDICDFPMENAAGCFRDCHCGDGTCQPDNGENCNSCSRDCWCRGNQMCAASGQCVAAVCGDGYCNGSETCNTCSGDCRCPSGQTCSPTTGSCQNSAPVARCGDGSCNNGENCSSCASDCACPSGQTCSSGTCGNTLASSCGNHTCDSNEYCWSCPQDCSPCCGDGTCNAGENVSNCPGDCGVTCGDGVCSSGENVRNCGRDCSSVCGDGVCWSGENVRNCGQDCGSVCGDGVCWSDESCGSCSQDCGACAACVPRGGCQAGECGRVSDGCGGWIPNCPPCCVPGTCGYFSTCGANDNGCGGTIYCGEPCQHTDYGSGPSTSTPFLFTWHQGQYLMENDFLVTYKDPYYAKAKDMYESDSGDKRMFHQTDYYRMRLNPDVTDEGIKLQIKELEPEESHIDQIKLLRVVHPKDAYAFVDEQTSTVKTVGTVTQVPPASCAMGNGQNCIGQLAKADDASVEGNKDDVVTLTFNIKGLDKVSLYLTVNSWMSEPLGVEPAPFKAAASANGDAMSLRISLIDPKDNRVLHEFNDIHPRDIAMRTNIALADALAGVNADILTIRILWTAHHFIDYVGILSAPAVPSQTEELALLKATGKDGDLMKAFADKDKNYVSTVRGDAIDLVFAKPTIALKADQADTYFFVSSGFYHGLRTYLHPNVDPSKETFEKEFKAYVDQLNDFLKQ